MRHHGGSCYIIQAVAVLLGLTGLTDALVGPHPLVARTIVTLRQTNQNNDVDIEDVTKEAEEALAAANEALGNKSGSRVRLNPAVVAAARERERQAKAAAQFRGDAIAAAIGASALGATVGGVIWLQLPELRDSVELYVPPLVGAATLGGAAFAGASQDNRIGRITRNLVGGPAKLAGKGVAGVVKGAGQSVVNGFKAIPGKIVKGVENQLAKTAQGIQALPSKLAQAAQNKATETAESIKQLPAKLANAAKGAAQTAAEEIKATPGRLGRAVKSQVEKTVDDTQRNISAKVQDVKELPAKKLEELEDRINVLLEGESKPRPPQDLPPPPVLQVSTKGVEIPKASPPAPAPPRPLPPPPLKQSAPVTPPAMPKLEVPKIELPKVEVPKVELPKMELPKLEFPKMDVPPAPKPAPKKQPASDSSGAGFPMNEVTLQNLMGGGGGGSTAPAPPQAAPAPSGPDPRELERKRREQQQKEAQRQRELAAQRKKEAQAKQQAAQERKEKLQAAEAERQALQEQKRQETEARRQAQEQAKAEREAEQARLRQEREAEQERQRREVEQARLRQEREAEQERQRREAEARKAAAAREREQRAAAKQSSPSIPLFSSPSFNVKSSSPATKKQSAPSPKKAPPAATKAPRGVPTIVNWRKRRDGGVSGKIYGSPNFNEGDRVETTEIVTGVIENGQVVTTGSGSRYFLSTTLPQSAARSRDNKDAMNSLLGALPGATINLSQQRKAADKKAAEDSLKGSDKSKTFSLFGMGGSGQAAKKLPAATAPAAAQQKSGFAKQAVRKAPAGVPSLSNWKKNFDGSITGTISGSKAFSEGEKVTTSPIAGGTVAAGEIVRTGSGSRYFLS